MTNLIDEIFSKVHNTRIIRKTKAVVSGDVDPKDEPTNVEWLDVKLIVMSEYTLREVMRLDYNNTTVSWPTVSWPRDKTEPYRMFGIRVAFDDSLSLGKVLVAGEVA